ncbi:hypothetical protein NQ317_002231 [Molorchus minor]|uniref:Uncharacterized protein n=1 Tax=Molorchus minor TaxID=1323400 RepID=A0ABQ9JE18_9CUCU|nr:hypothetical protein NQ317_002231 [Molorchus minor]
MSDSELSESDNEVAFAEGKLRTKLNVVEQPPRQFANNVSGLKQKLEEIKLKLPWIELLDSPIRKRLWHLS